MKKLSRFLGLLTIALLFLGGLPFAEAANVTLPIACVEFSGQLFDTLTLSGGGITPTTLLCNGNTVNFTVTALAVVTLTVGGCMSYMCFFFASGTTYQSTTTVTACAAGTCSTSVVTDYAFGQGDNQVSLGACPIKDTSTVTLANNTMYLYSSFSGPGTTTVGGLSAEVASVTSAATAQSIQFGVYLTLGVGAVSINNPLRLIPLSQFSQSLAAGTKNTLVTSSFTSVSFSSLTGGYTFAIGLIGTNKIVINQSGFTGMTSVQAPGGGLPTFLFSAGGTSTALFFCAQSTYASQQQTQTIKSTIITTSTTTVTTSGTTTVTVNSANPSSPAFWYMPLFFIGSVVAIVVTSAIGIDKAEPRR